MTCSGSDVQNTTILVKSRHFIYDIHLAIILALMIDQVIVDAHVKLVVYFHRPLLNYKFARLFKSLLYSKHAICLVYQNNEQ